MKLLRVVPSESSEKKYDAIFENEGRTKKVSFGAKGMSDYTIHKDKERRALYLQRHRANENWDKPDSAGALSRWILWGDSTSFTKNVADFRRRFGV